ncbi:hypothetical protein [Mesorhizobium caraganae]|uniref:hypothetical protein n=1 Tax=Mesorhizobium caraganae TaxID=483206 RepID=UPI003337259A
MRARHAVMLALSALSIPAVSIPLEKARALESEKYTVYCADDRIEVSFWDLEQMKVRRSSNVCQFQSYTSYSSALNFAQKNLGGEGRVVVAEAVQTQASCRSDRYRLRDFLRCWSDEPSHSTRADARSSKYDLILNFEYRSSCTS